MSQELLHYIQRQPITTKPDGFRLVRVGLIDAEHELFLTVRLCRPRLGASVTVGCWVIWDRYKLTFLTIDPETLCFQAYDPFPEVVTAKERAASIEMLIGVFQSLNLAPHTPYQFVIGYSQVPARTPA